MVRPTTIRPDPSAGYKLGDENADTRAISSVQRFISDTQDRVLHYTTFDFGSKTLALTLEGLILADLAEPEEDGNPGITYATYADIVSVEDTGHDREIRLTFRGNEQLTFRMGSSGTVTQLKGLIQSYRRQFISNGDPRLWGNEDEYPHDDTPGDSELLLHPAERDPPTIADRVRFWEEQDRINQALIPRVIRQNELLSKHIAEHDDLPELVSKVISDALAEQARQYELALEKANSATKTAYDEMLAKANKELTDQGDTIITTLQQEANKHRRRMTVLAAGALAVAIAALVIAILI